MSHRFVLAIFILTCACASPSDDTGYGDEREDGRGKMLTPRFDDESAQLFIDQALENFPGVFSLTDLAIKLPSSVTDAFQFCENVPSQDIRDADAVDLDRDVGLHMDNAKWLAYLSANEYSHFAFVGQALEDLGFGSSGDGHKWWLRAAQTALNLLDELDGCQSCPFATQAYKNSLTRRVYAGEKIQFFSVGSTQVIWAEHRTKNMAILVFRGTEVSKFEDIAADLRSQPTEVSGWGHVHTGFWRAWADKHEDSLRLHERDRASDSIRELIEKKLATVSDREGFRIWVSGHSLGGAMAVIAAASIVDTMENGLKTKDGIRTPKYRLGGLYTFGQPRVGHGDMRLALNYMASGYSAGEDGVHGTIDDVLDQPGFPYLRFRHGNDIVSQIPGSDYEHAGQLFHLAPDSFDNMGIEDLGGSEAIVSASADHGISAHYYPRLADDEIATRNLTCNMN